MSVVVNIKETVDDLVSLESLKYTSVLGVIELIERLATKASSLSLSIATLKATQPEIAVTLTTVLNSTLKQIENLSNKVPPPT